MCLRLFFYLCLHASLKNELWAITWAVRWQCNRQQQLLGLEYIQLCFPNTEISIKLIFPFKLRNVHKKHTSNQMSMQVYKLFSHPRRVVWSFWQECPPSQKLTCLPAYLLAYLLTCLPVSLPAYLLLADLPVLIRMCFHLSLWDTQSQQQLQRIRMYRHSAILQYGCEKTGSKDFRKYVSNNSNVSLLWHCTKIHLKKQVPCHMELHTLFARSLLHVADHILFANTQKKQSFPWKMWQLLCTATLL